MKKNIISKWNYYQLNKDEQQIYQDIYNQIVAGNCKVLIRNKDNRYDVNDMKKLLVKVIQDNPLLFHISGHQFTYTEMDDTIMLHIFSIYDEFQYMNYKQKIMTIVDKIVLQVQKYNSFREIIKCFHDILVRQVDYEYAYIDEQGRQERHTVVGALLFNGCVCDGFSNAMKLLCDAVGLDCLNIKGYLLGDEKQELHAWNLIMLEDSYWHIDVTMDYMQSNGCISYDYFMKKDTDMRKTHQWEQTKYPVCD